MLLEREQEPKPKSTRAHEKAKKERSVAQRSVGKSANGAKSPYEKSGKDQPRSNRSKSASAPAKSKNRQKDQKNKGKPKR